MQIYLIYGNQPLEIREMVTALSAELLPAEALQDAVFQFDAADFVSGERNRAKNQFTEFQNTCRTVSFFSPQIVVEVRNLQKIPLKKSPVDSLQKSLQDISLVKGMIDDVEVWFDADSLVERSETRHHFTAFQAVEEVMPLGGGTFYLRLDRLWENKRIYRQKGKGTEALEIKTFLRERIKQNLVFEMPDNASPLPEIGSSVIVSDLVSMITHPPPQVTLVFTADIRNVREINKEIYQALQQNAKELKATIAYDDFRPISWIVQRASAKQLQMDAEAADLLIEIAGTDFAVLDMELDKLSLLFEPGVAVTAETLLKSTSHSKRFSKFRIADFLVQKNQQKTMESLESILQDQPGEAIGIFGLISVQFRRMLKIAWMLEQGQTEKSVLAQLKLNPWVARQVLRHTRNFTRFELENIVVQLAKTDLQIKFFAKDALSIMENLCFQICQGEFDERHHIERQWLP